MHKKNRIGIASIMVAGTLVCAHAQWLNYPTAGTPRTRDGRPNLSAKAPRAANGRPDLSGVWQVESPPAGEIERLFGDLSAYVVPGDDPRTFSRYYIHILSDFSPADAPLRPEAGEITARHAQIQDHPTSRCLPMGLPGVHLIAFPFKILQTPQAIVMMYEVDGTYRQVHTDGRRLPVDPQPAWLGYSVGRWDGDTLVVNTAGFNDKTWLDAIGHPHSEEMQLEERFHRRDFGHIDVRLTITDPGTLTRPITITFAQRLLPDTDILEFFCNENEKDRVHMPQP